MAVKLHVVGSGIRTPDEGCRLSSPDTKTYSPSDSFALTPRSIGVWLFFEWIYVGPTEEISFRGLLQTFLMQRSSGRVRFRKYEMHIAGVVLALLFALAHVISFWTENVWIAFGQQTYAFALGILYAYWREKSGSLLAPIIGHSVGDGVASGADWPTQAILTLDEQPGNRKLSVEIRGLHFKAPSNGRGRRLAPGQRHC